MPDYGDGYRSYPTPYQPAPAPEPPPDKTLSGWALGLSLFPCGIGWILSIVFSCMVLSRSKDGRDHGRGRAIAAFVIMGAWMIFILAVVLIAQANKADRDETGAVVGAGDVTVDNLRAGDCTDLPDTDSEVYTVRIRPCSAPHQAEVFAVFDLDAPFTDSADADRRSQGGCLARFEDFVGEKPALSELGVFYFRPRTALEFARSPSVACLLATDETVTKSLRDTAGQV